MFMFLLDIKRLTFNNTNLHNIVCTLLSMLRINTHYIIIFLNVESTRDVAYIGIKILLSI